MKKKSLHRHKTIYATHKSMEYLFTQPYIYRMDIGSTKGLHAQHVDYRAIHTYLCIHYTRICIRYTRICIRCTRIGEAYTHPSAKAAFPTRSSRRVEWPTQGHADPPHTKLRGVRNYGHFVPHRIMGMRTPYNFVPNIIHLQKLLHTHL